MQKDTSHVMAVRVIVTMMVVMMVMVIVFMIVRILRRVRVILGVRHCKVSLA